MNDQKTESNFDFATSDQLPENQEDRMHSVFMQTSVSMCIHEGPEHVFKLANPTYSTLFGNRDLLGKPIRSALPELMGQGYCELLDQVYATGKPFIAKESPVSLLQDNGLMKEMFLDIVYQPQYSLQGKTERILVIVNDVTESVIEKRTAEKLAKDLQKALEIRDEFLSVASHELKTPITSLKLQLYLVKRKIDQEKKTALSPEKLTNIFNISSKQIDRLTYLVEDLLDVSRIQAGKMDIRFEPTCLRHLVQSVVDRLSDDLIEKDMEVVIRIPDTITGNWDRSRLEQVVSNLLTNAMKYASGKPVEITASQKNKWVKLTIKDNGPGIPNSKKTIIFDRFERIVPSKNVSGLGLGLYIVKKIIEAHEGTVQVESHEGLGSNFIIKIPVNPLSTLKCG